MTAAFPDPWDPPNWGAQFNAAANALAADALQAAQDASTAASSAVAAQAAAEAAAAAAEAPIDAAVDDGLILINPAKKKRTVNPPRSSQVRARVSSTASGRAQRSTTAAATLRSYCQ